jgi:hypothetical protein
VIFSSNKRFSHQTSDFQIANRKTNCLKIDFFEGKRRLRLKCKSLWNKGNKKTKPAPKAFLTAKTAIYQTSKAIFNQTISPPDY